MSRKTVEEAVAQAIEEITIPAERQAEIERQAAEDFHRLFESSEEDE